MVLAAVAINQNIVSVLKLEVSTVQQVLYDLLHTLLCRGLIAIDVNFRVFGGFVGRRDPGEFCMVSLYRQAAAYL